MKIDLSVLKIVSTCIVIALSFVLLTFSLIGVLTNVHATIASPTGHPSLANLPTTPTPTHKHKHKHTLMPPSTATTQSIATPTTLSVPTNNDSTTSQDFGSPFISALTGTLISAGVALLVSILFLRILRWRQGNKNSHENTVPLIESQETLPFNDIFPPTDDTPTLTNQPQTAFNNGFPPTNGPLDPAHQPQISFSDMFLPTNGSLDPAHQPQISFSDMFLSTKETPIPTHQPQTASNGMFPSDPRNLPTRS